MRAYIAQKMDDSEELRSKLRSVEGKLATSVERVRLLRKAEDERETTNVEAHRLKKEGEEAEAKCKKVEQENEQLRKEMKKLQAGRTTQKEELEGEYQKQVENMFFFSYRCFMKKHGITQDIPNYPSDDEDTVADDLAQGDGDIATIGPSGGQT